LSAKPVIAPTLRRRTAPVPSEVRKFAEMIEESEKVLDLGAGTGHKTAFLCTATKGDIYACDICEEFVEELRKLIGFKAFKCDVRDLGDVPDNYFDKVLCWHVLMFIPKEDLDRAIEEIKRITKDGGVVLYGFYRVKSALNPDFTNPETFREASRYVCEKTGDVLEFRCKGRDMCYCFVKVRK